MDARVLENYRNNVPLQKRLCKTYERDFSFIVDTRTGKVIAFSFPVSYRSIYIQLICLANNNKKHYENQNMLMIHIYNLKHILLV
jgi:hypothetical protein